MSRPTADPSVPGLDWQSLFWDSPPGLKFRAELGTRRRSFIGRLDLEGDERLGGLREAAVFATVMGPLPHASSCVRPTGSRS